MSEASLARNTILVTIIAIMFAIIMGLTQRGDSDQKCIGGWDTRECYDTQPVDTPR